MPTIERQIDALGGSDTPDGYSDALTDCLPIAADADALDVQYGKGRYQAGQHGKALFVRCLRSKGTE